MRKIFFRTLRIQIHKKKIFRNKLTKKSKGFRLNGWEFILNFKKTLGKTQRKIKPFRKLWNTFKNLKNFENRF